MKKPFILLFTLVLSLITSVQMSAQSYTLVPYQGTFETLVGSVSISAGEVWDDPWYGFEMPIDFYFFNQSVDSIYISDGHIAFDSNLDSYISAYEADLVDAGIATNEGLSPISWTIDVVNSVNVLKIEWLQAGFYNEYQTHNYIDNVVSFQIWLYEGTDEIEIHYGTWQCVSTCSLEIDFEAYVAIADGQVEEVLAVNGGPGTEQLVPNSGARLVGFPASGRAYWFQPYSTCNNGYLDAGENGIDCGGSCFACHCGNGIMDADETGVDCGGIDCAPCVFASCNYDNAYYEHINAPTEIGTSASVSYAWGGDIFTLTGLVIGNTYEISTCSNDTFDTQLSLFTEGGEELIDFNDDYEGCGLQSVLFYTAETADDVDILLDEYGCKHNEINMDIEVTLVSGASSGCGGFGPEICIVTYSDIDNKNLLVWEQVSGPIDHYNIYRETNTADKFDKIGMVAASATSIYLDQTSNPVARYYKYKISAVDSCGVESAQSPVHKTALLQQNVGTSGQVNLIWSGYSGLSFGSYVIWRVSDVNGEEVLDTIPSNMNFYTDQNPPQGNQLYYQLELLGDLVCSATPKTTAKSFNSGRSNTVQIIGLPVAVDQIDIRPEWSVYPNPVQQNQALQVIVPAYNEDTEITVVDAVNRLVHTQLLTADQTGTTVQFQLNQLEPGIYSVRYTTSQGADQKRLVVR